ncbi:MAG TPA: tetratricopeptide repeat protein [Ignavibacteria bacterium]|nr:tetratricopeptide repeat protein [Ignavibacteria bacterium]
MKKNIYNYLIIIVCVVAAYYNSLQNTFVFDDESVILGNQSLTSLSNIPKFFTGEEGFHKIIGKYYRPIVSSSYNIDYAIWQLNPFGYHLTNLLIHLIATLILFRLLQILFYKYKYGALAALLGTIIFAVHPIHTEAVSWVSGRTDSFVTLFFFAAFLYYLKYINFDNTNKQDEPKYLALSLIFYALGLLTKEMIITFPVVIILFDWIYRQQPLSSVLKNFKTYLYFIVLSIVYLIVRYFALANVPDRLNYMYFINDNFVTVAGTMLKTVPLYFKLLFYPHPMLYHYNGVLSDANSFSELTVILSFVFLLNLIIGAVILYKKFPEISFCIIFFIISLLPVMNIIPTMNLMAERFLYITSFAVSLLIAYIFAKVINNENKNVLVVIVLIISGIYFYLTVQRNMDWKDNDTLYATGEGIDGSVLLVNAGNLYANKQQYDEAEKRFRKAIEVRYNSVLAHHNLGLVYLLRNQLDSAEMEIKKGIEIDSLAPDGYFQLAQIYKTQGKIDKAIEQLERLQSFSPNYKESIMLIETLRRVPQDSTTKYFDMNSDQMQIFNLERKSFESYQQQKYTEAISYLEELIKLDPSKKSGYLNNMGLCYREMGDLDNAEKCFNEALSLDEKNVNAINGLAEVLLRRGKKSEAINYYKKVLEINPTDAYAKQRLDSLSQ